MSSLQTQNDSSWIVFFPTRTGGVSKLVEVKSRMNTLYDKIPLYEQVTSLIPAIGSFELLGLYLFFGDHVYVSVARSPYCYL